MVIVSHKREITEDRHALGHNSAIWGEQFLCTGKQQTFWITLKMADQKNLTFM